MSATVQFSQFVHADKRHHDQFMLFYTRTVGMMRECPVLAERMRDMHVIFLLKGTNGMYYTHPDTPVQYSDFDYTVYIHPALPDYSQIFAAVDAVLCRSISEFKVFLDGTFGFRRVTNVRPNKILIKSLKSAEKFVAFQCKNGNELHDHSYSSRIYSETGGRTAGNPCAEVPLKRSPVVCSVNRGINFFRDTAKTKVGHFNMYRVRMPRATADGTVDIIDVSLFHRDDYDSLMFWKWLGPFDIEVVEDPGVGGILTLSHDATVRDMMRIVFEYNAADDNIRAKAAVRLAILERPQVEHVGDNFSVMPDDGVTSPVTVPVDELTNAVGHDTVPAPVLATVDEWTIAVGHDPVPVPSSI
jgi:hypothetical protein